MDIYAFARRMPKAELHVHLEGAIQPQTLLRLAERNGIDLPAKDLEGIQAFYKFRDFAHFIDVYVAVTGCLRTQTDYCLIAYQFGEECARQNIRYAEATFSIETNMRMSGLPWRTILEGLNNGREAARQDFGVELRWIFDIVRDIPHTQDGVLEIALAARSQGCVALGLGGSEAGFPPELFHETFERAHQAGLPAVLHAGENAGPESVWRALDELHATRIEHGVRAIEDPVLVAELARRQIALDVCPTSNLRLGIYPNFPYHPLRRLWDAGVMITLASDDPPMFSTDLNQEYQILIDHFGFGIDELQQISLNGVRASLLPSAEKEAMLAEFREAFVELRKELV